MAKRTTARKRAKAPTRKRAVAPKAQWSKWITDTYGQDPCTDGKAALTFAQALEKAGRSPDEVWEIAPEAWKEKVVEACQEDNGYEDALLTLSNALDYHLPGNTPQEVHDALSALIDKVGVLNDATQNADISNTPTLAVQDGKVVITSWA